MPKVSNRVLFHLISGEELSEEAFGRLISPFTRKNKPAEKLKPLCFIESPYAGDVEANMAYLDLCMKDSADRGEVPVASHALFTRFWDDTLPEERQLGLQLADHLRTYCDRVAFYVDRGFSSGMRKGLIHALQMKDVEILRRTLNGDQRGVILE